MIEGEAVLVVRQFDEPCDFQALQAQEDAGAWCLQQHRVTFRLSYFARDRLRMICLYHAPDAESVRIAQRTIAMPVEDVWSAQVLQDDDPGDEVVCVERSFSQTVSPEMMSHRESEASWCMDAQGVDKLHSLLSVDGRRALCAYRGLDVEAVRRANRTASLPVDRLWAARIHRAG